MTNCLQVDPNDRPIFTKICSQLMRILEASVQGNYLNAIGINEDEIHEF
jgi:hypothetical protein